MSSAEPILGADLYIKAIESGLPKLFTEGGEHTSAEDFGALQMTSKDMARFLFKKGMVANDENGVPQRNDAKIRKLSEKDQAEFLPLYEAAVRENENAAPKLIAEGKRGYVDYVREMHSGPSIEVEAETVTRVREEDMQAITSASLNLLDAVHKDPANAAFVKGLDTASMDAMWSVLEKANYLMPGENPDRTAPLGEQALRGTPEEREAILFQASALVSNMELPDTINAGDRPTTYAMMLRNSVQGAKTEEVEIEGLNASPDMFFDSDLQREDANTLFNFLSASNRMMQAARYDTEDVANVVVPAHLAETTRFWLEDAQKKSIPDALGSGNFEAPGIDSKFGIRIAQAMKWADEAFKTDAQLTNFTGDDGGALTQEGAMQDEKWGLDNAFDSAEGRSNDGEKEDVVSDDIEHDDRGDDSAADRLVGTVHMTALNESMISMLDHVSTEALEDGALEKLRMHAGRASSEIADLASGRAAFGSFEEAMGADRVATTPEVSNRLSETMTTGAWLNMNPERRQKLRVAQIEPGRGVFKGYKPTTAESAKKRLTKYLDDNMLTKEGKPNLDMRRFLRDASEMPVVARTKREAEVVRDYAQKFVAREHEEHLSRNMPKIDKDKLSNVEFSSEDAMRMIRVAEASGNDAPARLTLTPEGDATLSHPDAPKFASKLDRTPDELARAAKSPREFGGHVRIEQLKAAVETGAEKIVIQVNGETPVGVAGKLQEAEEPVKTRSPKKAELVVLS